MNSFLCLTISGFICFVSYICFFVVMIWLIDLQFDVKYSNKEKEIIFFDVINVLIIHFCTSAIYTLLHVSYQRLLTKFIMILANYSIEYLIKS